MVAGFVLWLDELVGVATVGWAQKEGVSHPCLGKSSHHLHTAAFGEGGLKHLLVTSVATRRASVWTISRSKATYFTLFWKHPRHPTELEAQGFAAAGLLLSFPPGEDR